LDPLITIETVPIKIEYSEKKSANKTSVQSAKLNISRNDNSMMIHSDPISIPMTDTLELNSSNDLSNLTYTATARYSGNGNLRMNVQMNSAAADNTYQYQQFGRGIDSMVDFVPRSTGKSSGQIENMKIDFDMSGFFGGDSGDSSTVDTSFYPPDLELKVVETAKVVVKYVGGPIYVPPSADPDYDPSQAIDFSYFPQSASPEYVSPDAGGATYFPESADPNYDEEVSQMLESKSKLDLRA
jgi:hypothetical protein